MKTLWAISGFILAIFGLLILPENSAVFAQSQPPEFSTIERRSRHLPQLTVQSPVPTAIVTGLSFAQSDDGYLLYMAGHDKTVRRYRLTLEESPEAPLAVQTLESVYWPTYRGLRGRIDALLARPEGVAFGGFGAKIPQLALFQESAPESLTLLLSQRQLADNAITAIAKNPTKQELAVAYQGTPAANAQILIWQVNLATGQTPEPVILNTDKLLVRALAFSPDGNALVMAAYGNLIQDQDKGEAQIQLWKRADGRWTKQVLRDFVARQPDYCRAIRWQNAQDWTLITETGLVTAGSLSKLTFLGRCARYTSHTDGATAVVANRWTGTIRIQTGSQPPVTLQPGQSHTFRLAGANQPLTVIEGPVEGTATLLLFPGQTLEFASGYACGASMAGGATLICGEYHAQGGQAQVHVIDAATGKITSTLPGGGFQGRVEAVSVSPDGKLIAAVGLVPLMRPKGSLGRRLRLWQADSGQLLAEFPKPGESQRLPSKVLQVAFTGENRLLFAHPLVTAEGQSTEQWFSWQLAAAPGSRRLQRATPEQVSQIKQPLGWNKPDPNAGFARLRFGPARGERGFTQEGTAYIAQATNSGVQIFEAQTKRLVRGFHGTTGVLSCLCVSPDATWLVAGDESGRLYAYSLAALKQRNPLGAVVQNRAGKLTVTSVLPHSPAMEAGLAPGMQIRSLAIGGATIQETDWPAALADQLKNPRQPGYELTGQRIEIGTISAGKPVTLVTTVSQDPLWELLPVPPDWVLVSPAGYYEDTGPATDSFAAWRIGMQAFEVQSGTISQDVVVPLSAYAAELRKPDLLARLIETREPLDPPQVALQPRIRLNPVPSGSQFASADAEVEFEALIEPVGGNRPLAVELWLNAQRLEPVAGQTGRFRVAGQDLRTGNNHLVVAATIAGNGGSTTFRREFPFLSPVQGGNAASTREPAELVFLGIGVTALQHLDAIRNQVPGCKNLEEVKFADQDVSRVFDALSSTGRSSLWRMSDQSQVLTGASTSRSACLAALDQAVAAANQNPDNLLVVMLTGHGFVHEGSGEFAFLVHDSQGDLQETAIRQKDLEQRLQRCRCRVWLLLDTCHSAAARQVTQLQNLAGIQQGAEVLASCGADELSFEHPLLGPRGSGVCTAALLEALTGPPQGELAPSVLPDADQDGFVSVAEVCDYVRLRTPELWRTLDSSGGEQHPRNLRSLTFEPHQVRLFSLPASP